MSYSGYNPAAYRPDLSFITQIGSIMGDTIAKLPEIQRLNEMKADNKINVPVMEQTVLAEINDPNINDTEVKQIFGWDRATLNRQLKASKGEINSADGMARYLARTAKIGDALKKLQELKTQKGISTATQQYMKGTPTQMTLGPREDKPLVEMSEQNPPPYDTSGLSKSGLLKTLGEQGYSQDLLKDAPSVQGAGTELDRMEQERRNRMELGLFEGAATQGDVLTKAQAAGRGELSEVGKERLKTLPLNLSDAEVKSMELKQKSAELQAKYAEAKAKIASGGYTPEERDKMLSQVAREKTSAYAAAENNANLLKEIDKAIKKESVGQMLSLDDTAKLRDLNYGGDISFDALQDAYDIIGRNQETLDSDRKFMEEVEKELRSSKTMSRSEATVRATQRSNQQKEEQIRGILQAINMNAPTGNAEVDNSAIKDARFYAMRNKIDNQTLGEALERWQSGKTSGGGASMSLGGTMTDAAAEQILLANPEYASLYQNADEDQKRQAREYVKSKGGNL